MSKHIYIVEGEFQSSCLGRYYPTTYFLSRRKAKAYCEAIFREWTDGLDASECKVGRSGDKSDEFLQLSCPRGYADFHIHMEVAHD